MSQHRIIVDANVIRKDYESTNDLYSPEQALKYQLFYQISRLQVGVNNLTVDDRIDALQMSCHYWLQQLAKDQDLAYSQKKEEDFRIQLDKYWGDNSHNSSWIKY